MTYYAGKENNAGSAESSETRVAKTADDVRKGTPANLGVIIATAKHNGINLKVVDGSNYVKTQKDIDKGVEVVYVERGRNNAIVHAYYMNKNGDFVDTKSQGCDCFYAAFSKLLESKVITKSIAGLRNDAAVQIESNCKYYLKVLDVEHFFRDRPPNEANAGLRNKSELRKVTQFNAYGWCCSY